MLAVGLVASACGEPTVEMTLRLPTENTDFDMSCVTAVDVWIYGTTYPNDTGDRRFECIDIADRATFADVKAAISGKISLALPETGLKGAEVEGRGGPCSPDSSTTLFNLAFNAHAGWDGGDQLVLPINPVASCAASSVAVRAIDVLELVRTKDCALALLPDAMNDGVDLGTITPSLYAGNFFWAPLGVTLDTGVATVSGLTTVGSTSCLAAFIGSDDANTISCAVPGAAVCASPSEREFGVLPQGPIRASLDQDKLGTYRGAVVGSVWSRAAPIAPLAGATVEYDEDHGSLVYVEPSGTGLVPIAGTSTGPSGMFVLYTNEVGDITIKSSLGQKTVRVGATPDRVATVLVGI